MIDALAVGRDFRHRFPPDTVNEIRVDDLVSGEFPSSPRESRRPSFRSSMKWIPPGAEAAQVRDAFTEVVEEFQPQIDARFNGATAGT